MTNDNMLSFVARLVWAQGPQPNFFSALVIAAQPARRSVPCVPSIFEFVHLLGPLPDAILTREYFRKRALWRKQRRFASGRK
jgi:hypothetical protein